MGISPFSACLAQQEVVVLDGGLATELEAQGCDLAHPLWSARVLLEQPEIVRQTHRTYLEAGADCITAASYQVSVPGCAALGPQHPPAEQLIARAVEIACQARNRFVAQLDPRSDRCRPLVAASLGPYGAYLADGSEYCGDYSVSRPQLRDFHESRWGALTGSGADLVACETLPSLTEAEVLIDMIDQSPNCAVWLSFSCRDGQHICDGTPIAEVATLAEGCERVVAIGINCTAPRHVSSLMEWVRGSAPTKAIAVYPNAGLSYDGQAREWVGDDPASDAAGFAHLARQWRSQGASLIGGCCGIGPEHIKQIRAALLLP